MVMMGLSWLSHDLVEINKNSLIQVASMYLGDELDVNWLSSNSPED